jgi:hypothetical protein
VRREHLPERLSPDRNDGYIAGLLYLEHKTALSQRVRNSAADKIHIADIDGIL